MTDLNARPNRDPRADSLHRRIVEWFWRGEALARQYQSGSWAGERARVFGDRARASADLANLAWTSQAFEPAGEALACELYRQSAYWALCALSRKAFDEPVEKQDSESIWATLDQELLTESTDDDLREALKSSVRIGSFVYFAELQSADQAARCVELRRLSSLLLARLQRVQRELDAIRWQRIWRIGLVVVVLICGAASLSLYRSNWEEHHELLAGKAWRTSSSYGGGCTSPDQQCPEASGWFFHTREDDANPWIEFALDEDQSVSTVLLDNREDCCAERAVPLAIEVSDDRKHWRQVAERKKVFTQWRASFSTTKARWLRLRVLRRTAFHLARVRAFP